MKKIVILPKLYDGNGDIKKKWFIFFTYRNPSNNTMERFRISKGFVTLYTKKERYALSEIIIKDYTDRLKHGWNPFEEERKGAIYEDSLTYSNVSRVFNNFRNGNKTFNYYSNLFLPEVKGMAEKTYSNYVSKYRIFEAWLTKSGYQGNDINTLTPDLMREFFLFLINDQKLARITVMKYRHMLGRCFEWCLKKNYMKISPMKDLPDTTRENDQAPRPINEADMKILTDKIKQNDRQLWLTIQLEYYCFLRPGLEIRLARISWFDLSRGVIKIPKDLVKTRTDKIVIIPNQFREYLLTEWKLNHCPSDYYMIGKNGIPGPEPLGSNNLRNRFNVIRDELGLPLEYKLYSFKHTGNARAADAGIPAYHRQMQNGHASMRSTEEYLKNKIGFKSSELQNEFPTL